MKAEVERNEEVWTMLMQHYSHQEIADQIGISRQRVDQIIEQFVARDRVIPRDAIAVQHRAQLDACISEVAGWLEDCPKGQRVQIMAELRKWMDMRFRVYGGYAPVQQRHSFDGTDEPTTYAIEGMGELRELR